MKLVVIACVMAMAFGQTADGNDPQYTAVIHSVTGNASRFNQSASGSDSVDPSTIVESVTGIKHGSYGNNSKVEENSHEQVQYRNITATYGPDGNLLPPHSSINYNPATTQSKCLVKCDDGSYSTTRTDQCKDGCKTWMAYSSLNWETTWRPKLKMRCYKQCLQRRKWTHLLGDKAKHQGNLRQDFTKSYWMERGDDNYATAPYDRTKLPFHTAHHCTVNTDCSGNGECSTDHKLTNDDVDECINEAEVACKDGCDKFYQAMCEETNVAC